MFCPDCRGEYREGFEQCSSCGVALVESLPESEPSEAESGAFVVAHESSRSADIPVIRSVLESAGIPFVMEGKAMMNLFPSEFLGTMTASDSHAQMRFKVPADRAEEAAALLQENPTLESTPEELAQG